MSEKQNKNGSHHVSRRVQQTKKEIEQLKLELQKLITRGIETDKTDTSKHITVAKQAVESHELPNEANVSSICPNAQKKINTRKSCTVLYQKNNLQNETEKKELLATKTRHYNVNEAREFMKKQKEKRLENMKLQLKASQNVIDIRKEKLKELQKKSLHLVQKNVTLKRDRSRSKERQNITSAKSNAQHETKHHSEPENNTVAPNSSEINTGTVPDLIVNNVKLVPSICSEKGKNPQNQLDMKHSSIKNNYGSINKNMEKFEDLQKSSLKLRNNAAIRIQSCFRGYRQRNLFRIIKNKQKRVLFKESISKDFKGTSNTNDKKQEDIFDKQPQNDVPFWLQTTVQPYPYNFISAVKKKLNFAINTPIKTSSDIGIQISLEETNKNNTLKTKDDIKKVLQKSITTRGKRNAESSVTSHKCLDLDLKNIEMLQLCNNAFTAKNDCDKRAKNPHIQSVHSKHKSICLFETDASESDTSKNIPDISSESVASTSHSKREINTSDYKLKIDVEKLNKLKLHGKKLSIFENTIDILNDSAPTENIILINEYSRKVNDTLTENIQTDLGTHSIQKINSISDPASQKKESKLYTNTNRYKSKNIDIVSNLDRISKSENNVPEIIKIEETDYKKTMLQRNSKSEDSIFTVHKDTIKDSLSNKIECDDHLKSFVDYMTSLEESKKSRKSVYEKSASTKSSNSFKSLLTKSPRTSESIDDSGETHEKNNSSEKMYSSNFSNATLSETVPLLKRPSITLTTSKNIDFPLQEAEKNSISIKPGEVKYLETKTSTNQIHLKFEAELHLLNDFNESLRQFMAVEKSLIELQSKSQQNLTVYQNQDTQTTAPFEKPSSKESDDSIVTDINSQTSHKHKSQTPIKSQTSQKTVPTINYSRGSDIDEQFQQDDKNEYKSLITGLELSQLNESTNSTADVSVSNTSVPANDTTFNNNVYVGFSVGMFDQLIRDEDARIENLKTILKIREKALLDRTKGELAWLEIQKKQLIETGHLHEASLLKKKQRGIIIKLQHEKQEMQRLKQIQKAASKERKTILKEQRNMIKAQLSNSSALPKIRRSVHRERRHLGPVKVYNLHRETINTETSISRRSSVAEEIIITSRSESIVGQISGEGSEVKETSLVLNTSINSIFSKRTEEAKKSLLMREAALQKRKKAAEELLQWHQRLLEEERKIAELEMTANTIIKQVPAHPADSSCKVEDEKYNFKGSQLNLLWTNMTGRNEKKFKNDESYSLSQVALEKFCKEAKKSLNENKKSLQKSKSNSNVSNKDLSESFSILINTSDGRSKDTDSEISDTIANTSKSSTIKEEYKKSSVTLVESVNNKENTSEEYSTEFDCPEIIEEQINTESNNSRSSHTEPSVNEIDKSKSTLNEIMQNISNITDEISVIYKLSSAANTIKDESNKQFSKTFNDNTLIKNETGSINKEENIRTETEANNTSHRDESENDTSSTNMQSEIVKSLTELISSQNACQDSKSEQKHNIIEAPEPVYSKNISTDSQGTSRSNIELCTDTNEIRCELTSVKEKEESEINVNINLSNKSVQENVVKEDLTENILQNSTIEKVISLNKNSSDIVEDLELENNHSVMSVKCSVNNNSNVTNNSIVSNEKSQTKYNDSLSNNEPQNVLDLSYGFVGVRTKDADVLSSISEISDQSEKDKTTASSILHTENDINSENVNESDISEQTNNNDAIVGITNIKIEEKKSTVNNENRKSEISDKINIETHKINTIISNNELPNTESIDTNNDTTISTESNFKQSKNGETINNECEIECSENGHSNKSKVIDEISITQKFSSQIKSSESISTNNIDDGSSSKTICENESNESKVVDGEIQTTNNFKSDNNIESTNNIIKSSELDENSNDCVEIIPTASLKLTLNENEDAIRDTYEESIEEQSSTVSSENEDKFEIIQESNKIINKVNQTKDNLDNVLDIKKRVSEILADTTCIREDKSPRLQDIYTTTYDILSPEHSPETGSPANSEKNIAAVTHLFDEEAEALFKKQLAIEQEIKQLEQQQKEQIPYMYMREIPNKPPPPYTPPVTQVHITTALPSSMEQLNDLVLYISDKLYTAYENGNIEDITANNLETKFLNKLNIDKDCYDFVFDLCKELAIEHYKQFVEQINPSWMIINKKLLTKRKPYIKSKLHDYLFRKVKELLGFEKVLYKENMTSKWSRKKRDHVDELLVIESQTEESEWTNYDDDELIVKNELTNNIMNMLLSETAQVISKIFTKKRNLS